MHFQWIVIHLLCMASALHGQAIKNVFDYQPQQIHISFGGMLLVKKNEKIERRILS